MIWLLILSSTCIHLTYGDYRLPGDVIPKHYDVKLIYDIDPSTNYSFYGVVDIIMKAIKPTSKIILHAQDFTILARKITLVGVSDFVTVNKVSHMDGYDFLILELQDNLVEQENYTLSMPFYGNVEPRQDGVFVRSYVGKDYKNHYVIATHFEPISARRAFPCFDEPLYKASFRLTIGHHKDYIAVSNMPIEKTTEEIHLKPYWPADVLESTFNKDKWNFVYDKFTKTPRMSTYLVAFVISKFKYQDPPELTRFHFRTWARSEVIKQTATSLTGPKILHHFEKWYNTSYPLPKLDIFAIPDFPTPSMENWGLIMYNEQNVLSHKYHSTLVLNERIAKLISHELSHQWFGNLVTMKWWSDLWLKEGLAKFVESVGMMALDPQWKADTELAVESIMPVLDLDSLDTSHPLSVSIDDPKRLNEIFDEFAYCKGSSLIRMLFIILGEKVFRRALHDYLDKYAYSNADQDDLWRQFTDTMEGDVLPRNLTVKNIMDTWTRQAGYPLLTVERDYANNTVQITQKRYVSLDTQSPGPASWWVPISMMSQRNSSNPALHWLEDRDDAVQRLHHQSGPDDWLLVNYNMIAPYRVNYDTQNWQTLAFTLKSVKYTSIPALGRVQLLSDALELAWTNRLDYSVALDLASYLQRERNYLPLKIGYELLSKIDNVLKRDPDYYEFQRYMRRLVADAFWSVGGVAAKQIYSKDDLRKVKLQVLVSEWACSAKTSGCEQNAIEMFDSWMKLNNPDEENPVPEDLRSTVYCVAISRGSVRHWKFLHAMKQNAKDPPAREIILNALSCTREIWLLHQYLERTIAEYSTLSSDEAAAVIAGVVRNPVGYTVAKEFIYNRIADIYSIASIKGPAMGVIMQALLGQFTSQQELDEFVVWSEKHNEYLSDCVLAVERAIEKAKLNIIWVSRNTKIFISKVNYTINEIYHQKQVITVRSQGEHPSTLSPEDRLRRIDHILNKGSVVQHDTIFYCFCVYFFKLLKYL